MRPLPPGRGEVHTESIDPNWIAILRSLEDVMATYLLLYRADPAAMAAMPEPTPEESAARTQAWMDWSARAGDAIVDFGNPTAAASPGADASVGGYSLLQADSYDAVVALLDGHPHSAMGGTIDVYEVQPISM